jgi:hypothetical protein
MRIQARNLASGTEFTSFTGTKEQILTLHQPKPTIHQAVLPAISIKVEGTGGGEAEQEAEEMGRDVGGGALDLQIGGDSTVEAVGGGLGRAGKAPRWVTGAGAGGCGGGVCVLIIHTYIHTYIHTHTHTHTHTYIHACMHIQQYEDTYI